MILNKPHTESRFTACSLAPATATCDQNCNANCMELDSKTHNVSVDFNQALYRISIHSVRHCTCHLQSVLLKDGARSTMAVIAQLVARRSHNPKVVSSILTQRKLAHCLGWALPNVHFASKNSRNMRIPSFLLGILHCVLSEHTACVLNPAAWDVSKSTNRSDFIHERT